MKEILKELSNTNGATGFEEGAAEKVIRLLKGKIDEVYSNKMGSVVGIVNSTTKSRGRVMIATHLDELAMIVRKIEKGFIYFSTLGGWDKRVFPGQEVVVYGKKKLNGVIGAIPPHFFPRDKSKDVYTYDELFVDVGLDEKNLKKNVMVGNPIYIRRKFAELHNGFVTGKAFDNRSSCTVLIDVLLKAKKENLPYDIFGVFTVEEEETGLGARTSSYDIEPDFAIVIDVTHGKSYGVSEGALEMNKGPVFSTGPNIHPDIFNGLKSIAEKYEIPYQIDAVPGLTGTDAADIQIVKEGIPCGLIGIPLRYMHTPVEVINLKDMERTSRVLLSFLKEFEGVGSDL